MFMGYTHPPPQPPLPTTLFRFLVFYVLTAPLAELLKLKATLDHLLVLV